MGVGKLAGFPPSGLGTELGRNGGGGGSRVKTEFEVGFIGAGCFRCGFGLGERLLDRK
jgi:hypothetical protein